MGRLRGKDPFSLHRVGRYPALIESITQRPEPHFKVFPGVTPGWDNSPRRKRRAIIFSGSSPEAYGRWLRFAIARAEQRLEQSERLVFINAWNEWGEGNHLEPDQRWGHAYLDATRAALDAVPARSSQLAPSKQ
jgi:lipopolysaccharide biosynthesis protein